MGGRAQQPRDIWRIDYQLDPSEDTDVESRPDRIKERITRHLAWLKNDVPWTMEWSGFYRAHSLALDEFVHGRVLFAGDAAHLVPIFGVRGLNSGLEDAETLAWQLSAVLHGNADAALLRAYSAERRDAWQQNIDNAGKSTLIMTPGSDGYRATRDAILALATEQPQLRHLINPRQSSATHARRSPITWPSSDVVRGVRPGDPLEDRKVRVRRGTGWADSSLNQVRGSGFAVIGVGDVSAPRLGEPVRQLAAALAPEPVCAVVLSHDGAECPDAAVIDDAGASVSNALGASDGEYFVVRPDGLVLCRVTDPGLLGDVALHLRSASAPTDPMLTEAMPIDPVPADATHEGRVDDDSTRQEADREEVWMGLSDALDEVPESDREAFLTRLTILLGTDAALSFMDAVALAMRSG